jgi:CubicO group peptidase (beta-lactamase class C family)
MRSGRAVSATAAALLALTLLVGCARPILGAPSSPGSPSSPEQPGVVAAPGGPTTPNLVGSTSCDRPAGTDQIPESDPASVGLDPERTQAAVAYASARGALSVRIYRHGCLVARSGLDPTNEWSPMATWSMTKGVLSLIVGRAVTLGLLDVDDAIGEHLDGLDAAHGAITVRQLLNQTSGLRFAWANDLNAAATLDSAALVLTRPFEAEPGTRFIYAQTTLTALVAVVEAAVGEDLQSFAQRELFGPVGIVEGDWSWQRDVAGRSHGFAFLDMAPRAVGRLGLLMVGEGMWGDARVLDAEYIRQGASGTEQNPAYGFLWWTNEGERHRTSGYIDDDWLERRWVPAAPADTFGMSGMFNQNVYVIPSLDMVVVRMGPPNELFGDPMGEIRGRRPAWEHRFFTELMAGVRDAEVPGPTEWVPDPDIVPVDLAHAIGIGF